MTIIDDEVRLDIRNSVLCWLATTGEDGYPNVSPKEIFTSYGENLIAIANVASPVSAKNIRLRPEVCVSFVDVFRQRGFKLQGLASLLTDRDPAFASVSDELTKIAGPEFSIRGVIAVEVKRIARIWAPSYRAYPDRSERERMDIAYANYGVKPIS